MGFGFDRTVHSIEAADGAMEPAVAASLALGSAAYGGLAQLPPPPPPPPDFWARG